MSRGRDLAVYGLLILLSAGFVGWQCVEHARYRESARQRLLNISRNLSRSLEIIVGSQRRGGGIIPREPLEGALAALVENGPLEAIAVYNNTNEVIARAGGEIELGADDLLPGKTIWGNRSLTIVQLIQLGQLAPGPMAETPPDDETGSRPDDGALIMDRETAHRIMREVFEREPSGANGADAAELEHSLHGFMRRLGQWRGSVAPEVLRQYGLSKLVFTISTSPIESHIRRDSWMRYLLSGIFLLAQAAIAWGWYTSRRSAALNLKLIRAEEMNRHLQEMNLAAAGLAHETKNPLNVIRNLAQVLHADAEVPEDIREQTELVMREVDAVASRLNEFIEYSKPRQPLLAPVALLDLVRDTGRVLQPDLDDKRIRFAVAGAPVNVTADAGLLRQAVFNLVLNACQVLPPGGGITCRITVGATVSLAVVDNGPGVPEEEREEIFRPYYTLRPEGTGLGLAVVRQIVQAHGWTVACGAADGGGAVFTISGMTSSQQVEQHG